MEAFLAGIRWYPPLPREDVLSSPSGNIVVGSFSLQAICMFRHQPPSLSSSPISSWYSYDSHSPEVAAPVKHWFRGSCTEQCRRMCHLQPPRPSCALTHQLQRPLVPERSAHQRRGLDADTDCIINSGDGADDGKQVRRKGGHLNIQLHDKVEPLSLKQRRTSQAHLTITGPAPTPIRSSHCNRE